MKTPSRIALALAALLITPVASADDNKSIIKHREAIMEGIAGHFSAAYVTLKGMDDFKANRQFHAESLARLAKIAPQTFPKGSGDGKTEALAAVWEKPEAFKEAMDTFITRADEFAIASTQDEKSFGAAANALGKSCKGCHDDFKSK